MPTPQPGSRPASLRPLASLGGLIVSGLAGCGNVVDLPPIADPIPLIEAVLVAGERPTIRVTLLDPGTGQAAPLAPDAVRLDLAGPGTGASALTPTGDPTVFEAAVAIVAGGHYRLAGTVAGLPITAVTNLPDRFTLAEPAADTVTATSESGDPVAAIPYRFAARGAASFLADSLIFDTGEHVTRFATGRLLVLARAPGGEAGPTVRLLALNRDADRYLVAVAPSTNIVGGFGVFGGALACRVVIAWRRP